MLKLLVLCVFLNVVVADPEPILTSLVTAPFKAIGRWLTGSRSNNYYKYDRYYHSIKYNDDCDGHYYNKRSVPDVESTDTALINDYTTPQIAGPLDYSRIHLIKKRSMDSLHEETIPELILPSSHASLFIQEENLVYDPYFPFNYFENTFQHDFKREAEEK